MIVADDNALALLLDPVVVRPFSHSLRRSPRPGARHRHSLAGAGRPGLGAAASGLISAAPAVVGAASSGAPVSTNVESSIGMGLLTAAPFTGPAAPFVAAAGAVMSLLALFGVGSGCGQTCILSSQYANQAEDALKQLVQTYFSISAPRLKSQQSAALRIFDSIWTDLIAQCSNPNLGSAGQRCISDRQSGACKWKQTADSPLLQYPGEPQPGQCWNWFSGYRDPIANDASVVDDTQAALSSVGSTVSSVVGSLPAVNVAGVNLTPILLLALAGGLVWAVAS